MNHLPLSQILSLSLGIIAVFPIAIDAKPSAFLLTQNQPNNPKQISWRLMTDAEKSQAWQYILNSRLGIAALNQLAIEGFISPTCQKTFYIDPQSSGFLTLLRVKCSQPQGASIAISYDEIRVIFRRFEDNIEDFKIERVSQREGILGTPLPD